MACILPMANWDAVIALSSVALAMATFLGVCGALYAGYYAKKAYEVSQSQRQIENIFRYTGILEELFKNTVSFPDLGDISYREALHYQKVHPGEFEINPLGWPVKRDTLQTENIVFKRVLELFNIFSMSILENSGDFRILYFRYGQFMRFIFNEMNRTESTKKRLNKYPHFHEVMLKNSSRLDDLPMIDHFGLDD